MFGKTGEGWGRGPGRGGKTSFGAVCSAPADVSLAETIVPEIGPHVCVRFKIRFNEKKKQRHTPWPLPFALTLTLTLTFSHHGNQTAYARVAANWPAEATKSRATRGAHAQMYTGALGYWRHPARQSKYRCGASPPAATHALPIRDTADAWRALRATHRGRAGLSHAPRGLSPPPPLAPPSTLGLARHPPHARTKRQRYARRGRRQHRS